MYNIDYDDEDFEVYQRDHDCYAESAEIVRGDPTPNGFIAVALVCQVCGEVLGTTTDSIL